MTRNETHDNGMEVRREVLGDAYVDAALEKTTPFTADFQDFITRYAWGEVWTRPTLVVSGAEDPATPPEHGRLIRDAIPGARFEVVPGAAHIANVERPEEITQLILTHLEAE